MKTLIVALMVAFASVAHADVIDDNVAKAEKSVVKATERLEKAKACQANREVCMAEMVSKAQKAAERANKKLADLTSN